MLLLRTVASTGHSTLPLFQNYEEIVSVSVSVRCSNQFWLISNGRESTVDLLTVCESRFEALDTS